jgi:hypothetical protein
MPEARIVKGGCHCGAIRYEVSVDLSKVISCNCSICKKHAFLWSFVGGEQFRLLSDERNLSRYLFNKKAIQHLFCRICGVESFARGKKPDGSETIAVNIRCLDDMDLAKLNPAPYDGASK